MAGRDKPLPLYVCGDLSVFLDGRERGLKKSDKRSPSSRKWVPSMIRFSTNPLPPTHGSHKLAVPHRDLPPHRHHARPAFDLPAFKGAVVSGDWMGISRDLAAVVGVVDHQPRAVSSCSDGLLNCAPLEPWFGESDTLHL